EGKRRLPGAGEPGDTDEAVPRQADGDVLEVVLAGAVNYELVRGHNRPSLARRIGSNKCSEGDGTGARQPEARRSTMPQTCFGSATCRRVSGPTTTVPYPSSCPASDWSTSTASTARRRTALARLCSVPLTTYTFSVVTTSRVRSHCQTARSVKAAPAEIRSAPTPVAA